ncbi:MAG: hypothetical protein HQL64_14650 [Magnetococcales bacterium]|nr:hypothetical protein [Magnetococcales bacterium]
MSAAGWAPGSGIAQLILDVVEEVELSRLESPQNSMTLARRRFCPECDVGTFLLIGTNHGDE